MTRDDAVRQVHARITELPSKSDQASARVALAQLLRDVDRAARKDILEADRQELLTVLPELKPAVDRIIAELALPPATRPDSEAAVTRGEAIDALSAGLTRLPIGIPRRDLFQAFARLQLAAHVATAEGVVRQAYHTLVLALPELKPAVDRLLADWTQSSHPPKHDP